MKKFFVALIGGTVLLLGLVMLILPGQGVLVMAAGVAILTSMPNPSPSFLPT